MVPVAGLEPAKRELSDFKSDEFTNFSTPAWYYIYRYRHQRWNNAVLGV
jgi:hypothetical protein